MPAAGRSRLELDIGVRHNGRDGGNNMSDKLSEKTPGHPVRLADAPHDGPLRIVDIQGGEAVRRRLFSLGFHKGVLIRLEGEAILRGPLLVRNVTADCRVALGRGVAQKILVEAVHDPA